LFTEKSIMTSTKLISSSRFAISLLGGFAVYIDGNKLPDSFIEGQKARTLQKLLAHQRQFQMLRDQVAEILWPDLDIESANSLYKWDFLPVERYAEWTSFPREHYRQLYLDVLTSLSAAYEHQGNFSDTAEIMRIALDKEPTLETAHRGLMRIFAKKGQTTRAFHQYDLCRDILREELGISPSPETKTTLEDVQEGNLLENEKM
jgi:DNA-binding SARP family transcriptional activator